MKTKNMKLIYILISVFLVIIIVSGIYLNSRNTYKTYTGYMMNTFVSLRIKGSNADQAITRTISKINEIDNRFNAYDTNSELYKLNQTASNKPVTISNQFKTLLQESLNFYTLTSHVFDITIKPLADAWGINSPNPKVPSADSINDTLALVNSADIRFDANAGTVFFEQGGMSIDFGAIAKGHAANEVLKELKSLNIKSACIDLGGTILLLGKNGTRQWLLGIQDPDGEKGEYYATIPLKDKIVSTSGAYERNFIENGVLYHHIFDPRTGYSSNSDLKSVTIISSDGISADALSTSVFILGSEKGLNLVKNIVGTDAIMVTKDNTVIATEGIVNDINIVKEDYKLAE